MILIGLCGAAGSGKGEVARRLVDQFGFREFSFAEPIYAAVSVITGEPVERLKDRGRKEEKIGWIGKSPRELLQLLGTEFGRQMICDDIWIKRAMAAVSMESEAVGCVISDVRFDNEANAIRAAGGRIFEVTRANHGRLAGWAGNHISEAGIGRPFIDLAIKNDGTIEDLAAAVDAAFHSLLGDIM